MFGHKKRLKQIEEEKQQLEKEKQELLFIKEQLEDSTPKIDISNVYVWENKGVYSIVRLDIQEFQGRDYCGYGKLVDAYQSTLIDIFSNNIIYLKSSTRLIEEKEWMSGAKPGDGYYARLLQLHKVDKNILAYANKKVPLYVLQQLYYRLNNVDVNAYILKKQK